MGLSKYQKFERARRDIPAIESLIHIRNWVATSVRFPYLTLPPDVIKALDATKEIPGATSIHEADSA
jgi:hypothetical protein